MSFEDELKELILNAKVEQERREQELLDFRGAWQTTKLGIVKPVLDDAVKAIQSYSRFSALVEMRNGSIRLKMLIQGPQRVAGPELMFGPVEENREIECMYVNPNPVVESFSLDKLDRATVESKVKEFLSAALG